MMNSITSRYIHKFAAFLAIFCLGGSVSAQALFDNLDLGNDLPLPPEAGDIIGPRPDAGDRFFAQPFETDLSGGVASASVLIARVGSPSGLLHADIWSDDNGAPAAPVGRLASVEISTIPTDSKGNSVLFDGNPLSLAPSTPYHLVIDNIDLNIASLNDTFRLGMRESADGTNEAGRALVTAPSDESTWLVLGDLLPGSNYLRTSINTVPEPSCAWMLAIATIGVTTLRRRPKR